MTGVVLLAGIPLLGTSGLDYVYIPLVSTLVVVALGLILRWSMQARSRRGASRVADPSQGLLIGVVSTTPDEAERIRRLLTDGGVRATSRSLASRRQVLVWPDDVDTALRLVAADRHRRAIAARVGSPHGQPHQDLHPHRRRRQHPAR